MDRQTRCSHYDSSGGLLGCDAVKFCGRIPTFR